MVLCVCLCVCSMYGLMYLCSSILEYKELVSSAVPYFSFKLLVNKFKFVCVCVCVCMHVCIRL